MTPNRPPAHTGWANKREQVALRLIQLGDNMRLRAELGQDVSQGQIRTLNETADQWDQLRIPRQRTKEDAR